MFWNKSSKAIDHMAFFIECLVTEQSKGFYETFSLVRSLNKAELVCTIIQGALEEFFFITEKEVLKNPYIFKTRLQEACMKIQAITSLKDNNDGPNYQYGSEATGTRNLTRVKSKGMQVHSTSTNAD